MNRRDEIRERCEAGRPLRRIDVKWLLDEVDRLTVENDAKITRMCEENGKIWAGRATLIEEIARLTSETADLLQKTQQLTAELAEQREQHRISVNAGADAIRQLKAENERMRAEQKTLKNCTFALGMIVRRGEADEVGKRMWAEYCAMVGPLRTDAAKGGGE